MNLGSNKLPKGLVALEGIFNSNDQSKRKGSNLSIGKDDHVSMIFEDEKTLNLGKVCSETKNEIFIHLCQVFNDFFA